MKRTPLGDRRDLVRLSNPGPALPDGDGGAVFVWSDLVPPTVAAAIRAPTARDLQRLAAGTVIATGQRVLTFAFHPDVTVKTRVTWTDVAGRPHIADVIGVDNPDDLCVETVVLSVEVLT